MALTALTPQQIALAHLEKALRLYMRDLICIVTLAGAAEEVLGKLARTRGEVPSLERRVAHKMAMFSAIFPRVPTPPKKDFIRLSNQGRDAMKHLTTTEAITIDIAQKAGSARSRG